MVSSQLPWWGRCRTRGPCQPRLHPWRWTVSSCSSYTAGQRKSVGQRPTALAARCGWIHQSSPKLQTVPDLQTHNTTGITLFCLGLILKKLPVKSFDAPCHICLDTTSSFWKVDYGFLPAASCLFCDASSWNIVLLQNSVAFSLPEPSWHSPDL